MPPVGTLSERIDTHSALIRYCPTHAYARVLTAIPLSHAILTVSRYIASQHVSVGLHGYGGNMDDNSTTEIRRRKKNRQCIYCGYPITHNRQYYYCSSSCSHTFRALRYFYEGVPRILQHPRKCQREGCGELLPRYSHGSRKYCKDGCKIHKQVTSSSPVERRQQEGRCVWCGYHLPLEPTLYDRPPGRPRIHCSPQCATAFSRYKRVHKIVYVMPYPRICTYMPCDNTITRYSPLRRRYCSIRCRSRAQQRRRTLAYTMEKEHNDQQHD